MRFTEHKQQGSEFKAGRANRQGKVADQSLPLCSSVSEIRGKGDAIWNAEQTSQESLRAIGGTEEMSQWVWSLLCKDEDPGSDSRQPSRMARTYSPRTKEAGTDGCLELAAHTVQLITELQVQ